jgi:hypothetical protein
MIFKLELSPQNFHYDVLYPLYSGYLSKPLVHENKNFSSEMTTGFHSVVLMGIFAFTL